MATPSQRETIAFGIDIRAALLTVKLEIERAYEQTAAGMTAETVPDFLPRFHGEAVRITIGAMTGATVFTAKHVDTLLASDDRVPIPEAEAELAAEASVQMLRVLLARYQGGVAVAAQRQLLLGRNEEDYADWLLRDIQGDLPDGVFSLYAPVKNAYAQEAANAVNVQTSVVKFSMLAASSG